MPEPIPTAYLAAIGAKGGRKSRRSLSSEEARAMAKRSHAAQRRAVSKGKPWKEGIRYRKDAEVTFRGKVYRCTQNCLGTAHPQCSDCWEYVSRLPMKLST